MEGHTSSMSVDGSAERLRHLHLLRDAIQEELGGTDMTQDPEEKSERFSSKILGKAHEGKCQKIVKADVTITPPTTNQQTSSATKRKEDPIISDVEQHLTDRGPARYAAVFKNRLWTGGPRSRRHKIEWILFENREGGGAGLLFNEVFHRFKDLPEHWNDSSDEIEKPKKVRVDKIDVKIIDRVVTPWGRFYKLRDPLPENYRVSSLELVGRLTENEARRLNQFDATLPHTYEWKYLYKTRRIRVYIVRATGFTTGVDPRPATRTLLERLEELKEAGEVILGNKHGQEVFDLGDVSAHPRVDTRVALDHCDIMATAMVVGQSQNGIFENYAALKELVLLLGQYSPLEVTLIGIHVDWMQTGTHTFRAIAKLPRTISLHYLMIFLASLNEYLDATQSTTTCSRLSMSNLQVVDAIKALEKDETTAARQKYAYTLGAVGLIGRASREQGNGRRLR